MSFRDRTRRSPGTLRYGLKALSVPGSSSKPTNANRREVGLAPCLPPTLGLALIAISVLALGLGLTEVLFTLIGGMR